MTQYNFTVTERNGVQVFTSKKTGRVLTGAARKACEEALRRQEAQKAVQAQTRNIAEEEEYVAHIEAECDLITGMEISASEYVVMFNMTPAQRRLAIALSCVHFSFFREVWFGEFDPLKRREREEEARRAEEEARRAEEEEYVKHLDDISDLITGKEKSIITDKLTFAEARAIRENAHMNFHHQEGIAITGWAFNAPMFQRLMKAFADNILVTELCNNREHMHITTTFLAHGLRAMGWKYNRDRKEGFTKAVYRFLWRRTYDFDAEKYNRETKNILPGQFDPQSVRKAMQAVSRCAEWAMKRNEHEVITNTRTRPLLAMLCLRLLNAITTSNKK